MDGLLHHVQLECGIKAASWQGIIHLTFSQVKLRKLSGTTEPKAAWAASHPTRWPTRASKCANLVGNRVSVSVARSLVKVGQRLAGVAFNCGGAAVSSWNGQDT